MLHFCVSFSVTVLQTSAGETEYVFSFRCLLIFVIQLAVYYI